VVRGWLLVSATPGPTKTCCPMVRTDEYRPQVCWEIWQEKKHALLFDVLISEPQVSIGKLLMR